MSEGTVIKGIDNLVMDLRAKVMELRELLDAAYLNCSEDETSELIDEALNVLDDLDER